MSGMSHDEYLEKYGPIEKPDNVEIQKALLNAKLDKYSQKGHPGLGVYGLSTDSGTIMKARQVNKSSKGKHLSNYTPPKKKRK